MGILNIFDKKPRSGEIAKNRLQLVLIQDRMNTSPEIVEQLKSDILEVMLKYVDIDEDELDIDMTDAEETASLVCNIPIKAWKRQ